MTICRLHFLYLLSNPASFDLFLWDQKTAVDLPNLRQIRVEKTEFRQSKDLKGEMEGLKCPVSSVKVAVALGVLSLMVPNSLFQMFKDTMVSAVISGVNAAAVRPNHEPRKALVHGGGCFALLLSNYIQSQPNGAEQIQASVRVKEVLLTYLFVLPKDDQKSQYSQVNFLDTQVTISGHHLDTDIFIKPTDRNSTLRFDSNHPRNMDGGHGLLSL
ncbi:uncharacterized protein LOC130367484 [Hyla sarda]|uniref:uncharacterized protein LOC130367484 n=1 Tax=Hyla sarda TaxID=327740 RepID=UPI0024C37CD5|nr:uncharacterized protein LOC130367484 [Hyla sarda]